MGIDNAGDQVITDPVEQGNQQVADPTIIQNQPVGMFVDEPEAFKQGQNVLDIAMQNQQQPANDPNLSVEPATPASADPAVSSPAVPAVPVEPKDDKGRFEYWQGKHDTRQNENVALQNENTTLQTKLAQATELILARGVPLSDDPNAAPQGNSNVKPIVKPERPIKPVDYDKVEAVSDPESKSFQYRESLDDYRDDMIGYYEAVDQNREDVRATEAQTFEQQKVAQGIKSKLVAEHGYDQAGAEEFVKFFTSPESLQLDLLVQVDKIRRTPSVQITEAQKKAKLMRQKNNQPLVTPNPAVMGGQTPAPVAALSENDQMQDDFNVGLMRNKRI